MSYITHSVLPRLAFRWRSKRESEFSPYRVCSSLQCTKDALDDLKTGQMLQTTERRVMSLFVFKLKFLYGTGLINVYVFPNAKCSNKKTQEWTREFLRTFEKLPVVATFSIFQLEDLPKLGGLFLSQLYGLHLPSYLFICNYFGSLTTAN